MGNRIGELSFMFEFPCSGSPILREQQSAGGRGGSTHLLGEEGAI